jgi:hypothetical protein
MICGFGNHGDPGDPGDATCPLLELLKQLSYPLVAPTLYIQTAITHVVSCGSLCFPLHLGQT